MVISLKFCCSKRRLARPKPSEEHIEGIHVDGRFQDQSQSALIKQRAKHRKDNTEKEETRRFACLDLFEFHLSCKLKRCIEKSLGKKGR